MPGPGTPPFPARPGDGATPSFHGETGEVVISSGGIEVSRVPTPLKVHHAEDCTGATMELQLNTSVQRLTVAGIDVGSTLAASDTYLNQAPWPQGGGATLKCRGTTIGVQGKCARNSGANIEMLDCALDCARAPCTRDPGCTLLLDPCTSATPFSHAPHLRQAAPRASPQLG